MLDESFVYYIDTEVLNEVFSKIQSEQLIIDEEYKDDDISGKITTLKDNRTILTTIPYDSGWEVYVDGKRVETTEALNALVSFEIDEAGTHDIRFLYRPVTFKVGIVISLTSIAIFIAIIILENRLKKIRLVRMIFVAEDTSVENKSKALKTRKRK
jgi:uncharacterized membrane protein YfhO